MPKSKKTKDETKPGVGANDQPDMEFIGSTEEGVLRSIASRKKLRNKMNGDVEAFLQNGGSINQVEPNVMADPPRKPTSNYGSRPI